MIRKNKINTTKEKIVKHKEKINVIVRLRKDILRAAYKAQEGHIPSNFSILDIIWVLYDQILTPKDRFILSKGQGCLALYAVLAQKKLVSKTELLNHYCEYHSIFGGHPDRNKVIKIEASTGSLGHGLPIAIGLAMAARIKNKKTHIYCLIGDGEANEGSIWESALLASHHHLSSLSLTVDNNHSSDRALNLGDIGAKFAAFGWSVHEIDGHDHDKIKEALQNFDTKKPTCIIAKTIKGKGCRSMEGNPAWHHRAPSKEEYPALIKEIESG